MAILTTIKFFVGAFLASQHKITEKTHLIFDKKCSIKTQETLKVIKILIKLPDLLKKT